MADLAELFSSLIGNYLALNISRIRVPGTPHTLISRVDSRSETPVSQFVKIATLHTPLLGKILAPSLAPFWREKFSPSCWQEPLQASWQILKLEQSCHDLKRYCQDLVLTTTKKSHGHGSTLINSIINSIDVTSETSMTFKIIM